jgi:hypothetical protein
MLAGDGGARIICSAVAGRQPARCESAGKAAGEGHCGTCALSSGGR